MSINKQEFGIEMFWKGVGHSTLLYKSADTQDTAEILAKEAIAKGALWANVIRLINPVDSQDDVAAAPMNGALVATFAQENSEPGQ